MFGLAAWPHLEGEMVWSFPHQYISVSGSANAIGFESLCVQQLRYLGTSNHHHRHHSLSFCEKSASSCTSLHRHSHQSHLQHCRECVAEISQRSSCIISHHFVESRGVLQAVSDFYQGPFLVVLLGADVVQFDCQLLDVGAKVFYCLQPVCEVTERRGLVRNIHSIRLGLTRTTRTMPV